MFCGSVTASHFILIIMINTLVIARSLSESGLEKKQAEAVAEAIGDALDQHNGNLATKDFVQNEIKVVDAKIDALDAKIDALDAKIDAKIDALDAKMNSKISDLQSFTLRWVVATGISVLALQIAATAFLISNMS